MEEVYSRQLDIDPGNTDISGRLSYQGVFGAFMDIASRHASVLGIGIQGMQAKGLFWLTVKTRVRFFRRPFIGETVTVKTWPEAPEKVRGNRSYVLEKGEEILAAGKTEWAVMDVVKHRIAPMGGLYPDDLRFDTPSACPEPFAQVKDVFDEEDVFCEYRVRSTDIDVGGHMNNVAYVRALMSCFSSAEISAMDIRCIDVIFRSPCFEGDLLTIQKKQAEDAVHVRMHKNGETVLLASVECGKTEDSHD